MALWWLCVGYVYPVSEILILKVKFDLLGKGQLPHNMTGILTKVFCIFGPNLVILAWIGDKLLLG